MNNIYKVIWSKAKNCYVVASEIARSHTKSATGSGKIGGVTRRSLLASLMALSLLCGGLGVASAVDGTVHVDESSTPSTATEVYTTTKVDALLDGKANKTAVEEIKNTVGGVDSGLVKKTNDNATAIEVNRTNINTLKDTVGDDTKGLTKKINDNTAAIANKADRDALDGKADKADVYSKTDANNTFATKTELDAKANAAALDNKADKSDLEDATDRITTNEGNITDLKKKTVNLNADGTKLTDMTTVETGELKVTGKISNGTVNTTLEAIDASMKQTDTNKRDIATLQGTTNGQQTAIDDLKKKTTQISYDAAQGTTVNEVEFKAAEVNANGKGLTGVSTLHTTGDATVGGALTAAGVNAGTGAITGGSLSVTGAVTGSSVNAGTLSTTGNATVGGALNATGKVSGKGLDAGTEAITGGSLSVTGAVTGSSVNAGTLSTTGDATVGGNLKVTDTITTDKMVFGDKATNNYTEIDKGHITSKNDVLAGDATKKKSSMELDYSKLEVAVTDKDSNGHLTMTADKTTIKNSDLTEKNYSEIVADKDSVRTTVKDEKNNTTSTKSSATEIRNYAGDAAGNKTINVQTATQNKSWAKDKDGNESSIVQTGKDITNTAEKGTITNTAQTIVNNATGDMTNDVGGKLTTTVKGQATEDFKGGLDTTVTGAENHTVTGTQTNTVGGGQINNISGGQKNNILTGDQETTVSNGSIINKAENGNISNTAKNVTNEGTESVTNKAGDMTVTTDKTTGTTFGNGTPNDTTVINGGTIGTNKVNANETNTKKLTAGADDGANGGRLTVDADGVKGSYKSDTYTSKSYILANTLKSGVDNGKEPTDTDFVGSRTDHYMDGDKAKLDETVKDADGSNVTKKTSTDTATTITDGITTTKTEQGTKDITNTATAGTITNDAKVITNKASEVINNEAININNTATGTITSKASEIKNEADKLISNKVGENTWENMEDGKITTSIKNGTKQNLTQSDAEKTEHSVVNGSNSTVNKQTSEEITDAVTNGTTTNVTQNTATSSNNTIADTNGNANTVVSTVDGTKFTNTGANTAIREGTVTDTTIKGNTITTGKVTMDYAEVMKDLGVNGNATVKKDLTVEGTTKTKTLNVTENATVGGTLEVTGKATFSDDVDIANNLSVGKAVTAKSYKVGEKTYIDENGIHANGQKITDVADGSISEGSKDAVNGGQLYNVKNDLEGKVNKVGANAAAMANLHPMEFDPDSKWNIAAAIGNYGSETAAALGAFYRPNDDVMVNLSTAFGTGENMVGGGVSVRLGKGGNKLSREENNALKDQVDNLTARMDALLSVLNPNMSKDFPDVPENHWAYEAVSRLAGNDIVQGYPDGEFHGERTMTRYEMAEIIYNALSRGAEAEKELVEEFKPELQAMAASEKATAERAEG